MGNIQHAHAWGNTVLLHWDHINLSLLRIVEFNLIHNGIAMNLNNPGLPSVLL